MRTLTSPFFSLSALMALTVGCASSELTVSRSHPGHPGAPTAKLERSDALSPHYGESASAVSAYTCPMHPEISQKDPGNCPICGMKLVPKQEKK